MDGRLQKLLNDAGQLGISVQETDQLPDGVRGRYSHQYHAIWLRRGMSEAQKICTLQHELIHAERGDADNQPPHIENRINEAAAKRLISHAEYALAERLYGSESNVLARELGVTPIIITAYQRALTKHK